MRLRAIYLSTLVLFLLSRQPAVNSFIMGKAANNLRRKNAEKAAKQAKVKARASSVAPTSGGGRSSFRDVVRSFEESEFVPSSVPLLGANEHFQTIVGSER